MDRIDTENVANELNDREANGQRRCVDIYQGERSHSLSSKLYKNNLAPQFSPIQVSGFYSLTV